MNEWLWGIMGTHVRVVLLFCIGSSHLDMLMPTWQQKVGFLYEIVILYCQYSTEMEKGEKWAICVWEGGTRKEKKGRNIIMQEED